MSSIIFKEVSLKYPIHNARTTSIRNKIVSMATGGIIKPDGGQVSVLALDNVSFELSPGDSVGLVGHNGAGKTTLLRAMAGVYPPTSGTAVIEGSISTIIDIGAGMEHELTGYENIIRMGLISGASKRLLDSLIVDIESFSGLGDFLNLPVRTYSTGMLMRLMFSVATSLKRDILLLDEMFSTGDSDFQKKATIRMHELIEDSEIFVFASHSKELIEKLCNRIFIIEHGKIVEVK